MSIEAMAVCLHHSEATGSDRIVLLGIANHEGDGGSYPGVATLAKYARFTGWDAEPIDDSKEAKEAAQRQRDNARRQARRACRRLEELGEIETITNGGIGGRSDHERTNLYRVTITCPPNCDRSAQHRLLDPEEAQRRLRRALGLPDEESSTTQPVDNSANDPRTLESSPDSGVRGPRTLESSEPSNNQLPLSDLPESHSVSACEVEEPEELDTAAKARKRMQRDREAANAVQAPKHRVPEAPRYQPAPPVGPTREVLPPEAQERNREAARLLCPQGFGTGTGRFHLIPTGTGDGCAKCGASTGDILNALEVVVVA